MPAAVIRRTGAVIRLWDRLGRCARDRTAGCGGTYYGRMTAAVIRRIVAVIRRTVAVIRLRDRLGRCAGDRTGGDGGTYYGRMTSRRERMAHACRRDTAHRGRPAWRRLKRSGYFRRGLATLARWASLSPKASAEIGGGGWRLASMASTARAGMR